MPRPRRSNETQVARESLVLVEAGHFALALALGLSLIQFVVPLWGARANDPVLMAVARRQARSPCSPASPSPFLALTSPIVNLRLLGAQRRPELAFGEAADLQDLRRLGEPRGLHAAVGADPRPVRRRGRAFPQQRSACGSRRTCSPCRLPSPSPSCSSSCSTSNPFTRVVPAPMDGQDLNPLLQDPGLAIHPPLLYIGYVGFSISFAFAIAALIDGRIDAVWARDRAALDARRLGLPHARHRDGLVLGLLRARLGRLVVLGSGRERLAHAVARRHRAAALRPW